MREGGGGRGTIMTTLDKDEFYSFHFNELILIYRLLRTPIHFFLNFIAQLTPLINPAKKTWPIGNLAFHSPSTISKKIYFIF
jgi:hypothetical protein